jgi:hypothetical protein
MEVFLELFWAHLAPEFPKNSYKTPKHFPGKKIQLGYKKQQTFMLI